MTFDITFFGYGAGLVVAGWICGLCASIVFNIFRTTGRF
jgi:flagellar biosynthesis protein FliR